MAASNAKLALFYDWLFFNPEKDSIMNIGDTHTLVCLSLLVRTAVDIMRSQVSNEDLSLT